MLNIKKKPTILITGNEIGGQMQLLADTFRKKGYLALAAALEYNDFRNYHNDIRFDHSDKIGRFSRWLFFIWSLTYFDVFHFIYGVSFWSFWRFHKIDLPILKMLNKKIVVHFRGSDIIDKKTYYDYLLSLDSWEKIDHQKMSRPDQIKNISKWAKYADVLLVSTPNLIELVPNAILSPQLLNLEYWKTDKKPLSVGDGIVRIAHAPTNRKTKGTEIIIELINVLKGKGYKIELVLIENLPQENVKSKFEICDFGIDQLLVGWYGKTAVELMALGKPVVCNINPCYLHHRNDLPIVQADKNNCLQILEDLILNESKRFEIGQESIKYVSKYHDVNTETDRLLELYGFKNIKRNE